MLTAVQLRQGIDLRCSILYGSPSSYTQGKYGKIALFNDCQVVIYCIAHGRKQKAFAFRSCDKGLENIPGVYPSVTLLIEAGTKGKVSRLMRIITALHRRKLNISTLDDGFFIRVNTIINNREFRLGDVIDCLSR